MGRTLASIVVALGLAGAAWMLLGEGGTDPDEHAFDPVDLPHANESGDAGPGLTGAGGRVADGPSGGSGAYAIRGRVLGASSTGVAGIEVVARRDGRAWNPSDPSSLGRSLDETIQRVLDTITKTPAERRPLVARSTTDADGRFELRFGKPGRYRVIGRPAAPAICTFQSVSVHDGNKSAETVLTLREGAPLRGKVVDASDKPVQATLHASHSGNVGGSWHSWTSPPVTTGEDGSFLFESAALDYVYLTVHTASGIRLTGIKVDTPRADPYVLRVGGGEARLAGTVTDAGGAAVAGAHVAFSISVPKSDTNSAANVHLKTVTDSDGKYLVLGVPEGSVSQVQAVARGFLPYDRRAGTAGVKAVAVGKDALATIDVTLDRGGTVVGRLTAADSGEAIASGVVTLNRRQGNQGGSMYTIAPATTDAGGRFRFEHVPQGTYVALPEAKGYYLPQVKPGASGGFVAPQMMGTGGPPVELTVVMTTEGKEVVRNLELARGHAVRGRVVDAKGSGIAGAGVHARGYGMSQIAWQWGIGGRQNKPLATTADGGAFEIDGLPPFSGWVLYAKKDGRAGVFGDPFPLGPEAKNATIELKLLEGATLKGTVVGLDEVQRPQAQVSYWGMGQELAGKSHGHKVAPDGTWEITGVPPGDWTINLWMSGRQGKQVRVTGLKAGEVRGDLVLELKQGVTVSGVIEDSEGKPVASLSIVLQARGGAGGWFNTQTDKDGRFEVMGVPEARCQILTWGGSGRQTPIGKPFQAPKQDLQLVYDAPKIIMLRGKVEAFDGTPIAVCRVQLGSAPRAPGGMMPVPAGGAGGQDALNGRFEITATGEGPWRVTALNARGEDGKALNLRQGTVTVTDASQEITIRLEEGNRVSGRVVDEKGKGVAAVVVQVGRVGVTTDAKGAFEAQGLPDGKHTVQVRPPAGMVRPQVQHAAGGRSDLEFVLVRGLSIKGKALGVDGKPLTQGYANGMWQDPASKQSGSAGAQVQQDGSFELVGIPRGVRVRVQVQVWSGNGGVAYAPAIVDDVEPGTEDLEVRLGGGLSIEGKIVGPDGKPPENCFIYGRTEDGKKQTGWVQVGEGGTFKLGGLDAVPYNLQVARQDGGAAPQQKKVTPPARGVVIELPKSVSMGGRIAGLQGKDAAGWRVRVYSPEGKQVGYAQTNAEGEFEIATLAEGPEVIVAATKQGDERYARIDGVKRARDDLVLRLKTGRAITGTVEGAMDGERVRAVVWAESADGWRGNGSIQTDGTFRIPALPPGTYVVKARTFGQTSKQVQQTNVRDGTEGIRLDLR